MAIFNRRMVWVARVDRSRATPICISPQKRRCGVLLGLILLATGWRISFSKQSFHISVGQLNASNLIRINTAFTMDTIQSPTYAAAASVLRPLHIFDAWRTLY